MGGEHFHRNDPATDLCGIDGRCAVLQVEDNVCERATNVDSESHHFLPVVVAMSVDVVDRREFRRRMNVDSCRTLLRKHPTVNLDYITSDVASVVGCQK